MAVGENILSQCYDESNNTLTVKLAPISTKSKLSITLENAAVFTNKDFKNKVFDFLMEAQLPVETKNEIHHIYQLAACKEDIAVALNNLKLSESVRNALYEITFSSP